MAKRLILSAAIVIAAIFFGLVLSFIYQATEPPASVPQQPAEAVSPPQQKPQEPLPPDPPAEEPAVTVPSPALWCLREHNGRLAIFKEGTDTPELIFDVYTRLLPSTDRTLLQQGIYAADYEELTRLVEDYIS